MHVFCQIENVSSIRINSEHIPGNNKFSKVPRIQQKGFVELVLFLVKCFWFHNFRYPTGDRYDAIVDAIFREYPDIPTNEGLSLANSRVWSYYNGYEIDLLMCSLKNCANLFT